MIDILSLLCLYIRFEVIEHGSKLAWACKHDSLSDSFVKSVHCFCSDDTGVLMISIQGEILLDLSVSHVSWNTPEAKNWKVVAHIVALNVCKDLSKNFQVEILIIRSLISYVMKSSWVLDKTIRG